MRVPTGYGVLLFLPDIRSFLVATRRAYLVTFGASSAGVSACFHPIVTSSRFVAIERNAESTLQLLSPRTGPAAKQERSGPQRTWTHLRALASWPHCHSQRRLPNGTRSCRPYLAAPSPPAACRCRRHRSRRVCDHSHRTRATRRIRRPWLRRCKCQLSRQHLT